jgi:hypothetical protein
MPILHILQNLSISTKNTLKFPQILSDTKYLSNFKQLFFSSILIVPFRVIQGLVKDCPALALRGRCSKEFFKFGPQSQPWGPTKGNYPRTLWDGFPGGPGLAPVLNDGKLKGNPVEIFELSLAYPFSVLVLFGILSKDSNLTQTRNWLVFGIPWSLGVKWYFYLAKDTP